LVAGEPEPRVTNGRDRRQDPQHVEQQLGVARLLEKLRDELKTGRFGALPVRERMIPKRDGRMRRLGIPALRDRVVQMALKLVIEPIFESGFYASSYGSRPGRRAQDAIAEIVHFTRVHANYEWIIETDIEACFDRIDHAQLLVRGPTARRRQARARARAGVPEGRGDDADRPP